MYINSALTLFITLSALTTTATFASDCNGERICAGDRVIDANGIHGTAEYIYSNGAVRMVPHRTREYITRMANTLGKGCQCFEGLCVGKHVIVMDTFDGRDGEYTGTIVEMFDNGSAVLSLDYDQSGKLYYRKAEDLGININCIDRNRCNIQY